MDLKRARKALAAAEAALDATPLSDPLSDPKALDLVLLRVCVMRELVKNLEWRKTNGDTK